MRQRVCSVFFEHIWSGGDVNLWPLISKSNQLIFVPQYTKIVNLVKFPDAIYKILCSNFWDAQTDRQTCNPKTMALAAVGGGG